MREILFRGKRIDNGEWVEGFFVREDLHWHEKCIHNDWIVCSACANGGWLALCKRHPVDPSTIGQYTGICEKNGKKIFEGDIVTFKTRTSSFKPGFVRWYEEEARFLVTMPDGVHSYPMDRSWSYEVIGNKWDNPELLEGEG